jgi:hypothetical protein
VAADGPGRRMAPCRPPERYRAIFTEGAGTS